MNGFVPLVLLLSLSWMVLGLAVNVLVGTDPNLVVCPYENLSVNDQYFLVMRPDCNLIACNFSQPLLGTISIPTGQTVPPNGVTPNYVTTNCSLWMQQDGNLVIYDFTGQNQHPSGQLAVWGEDYGDTSEGYNSFLLLRGDGKFDFCNANSTLRNAYYNSLYDSLWNVSDVGYSDFIPTDYKPWNQMLRLSTIFLTCRQNVFFLRGKHCTKMYALEF